MSANLDLVRSIYADWERGDWSSADWADPEIEFVLADWPEAGTWSGVTGMATAWRGVSSAWEDYRVVADEYHELDGERVLVINHASGRGRTSGLEVDQITTSLTEPGANLFHVQCGKVTRLVSYWSRDRALADLGLEEYAVSQENLDLVRRSTQAFNDRDLDALESTFCEDVVMRLRGGFADLQGTEFRGRSAYLIWFKEMLYTLDVRATIEAIRAVGDQVVVVSTALGSGAASGVPSTLRFGTVYSFRGGRISTVDHYVPADDALKAVELEA